MTTPHPFRFGVIAAPRTAHDWRAIAQRAEQLGFATLVTADGMQLPAPSVSLAIAAEATTTLRVGTFVTSAALHPAGLGAWEAHSLARMTGGRFEFGIGTGHPGTVHDAVVRLGAAPTTIAQRLARVDDTVEQLRVLDVDAQVPVLVAAGGPHAIRLAARVADTVTLALDAAARPEQVERAFATLHAAAAEAGRRPELAHNIFVIGDEVPEWARPWVKDDAATLIANRSPAILHGTAEEMAAELRRRRDAHGVSYVIVNAAYMETMAPVVAMLAGR